MWYWYIIWILSLIIVIKPIFFSYYTFLSKIQTTEDEHSFGNPLILLATKIIKLKPESRYKQALPGANNHT